MIFRQGVEIVLYQFLFQRSRVVSSCLPNERSNVVVYRASSAALKINKIRFSVLYHHVSGLEVAIQECVCVLGEQVVGEFAEVVLKFCLKKRYAGGFEVAVFEVVEVPHDGVAVEFGLWVAH